MIEYFTHADPDYGKRVAEGLANTKREMNQHNSSAQADKAVKHTENMGHKTDGY